jgi:hypothetical protein
MDTKQIQVVAAEIYAVRSDALDFFRGNGGGGTSTAVVIYDRQSAPSIK